ncbi:hypothetical protein DPMN_154189 [Dreissena polymorpha]|uniref:Uncharacterized protein n=1 Tax=Dreissena polymorpha TaxID=45954 RepID=A0A9D4J5H5_DREPO|nr:hypothetical protein DPMN_154189 [Dreissena polymorpha]
MITFKYLKATASKDGNSTAEVRIIIATETASMVTLIKETMRMLLMQIDPLHTSKLCIQI